MDCEGDIKCSAVTPQKIAKENICSSPAKASPVNTTPLSVTPLRSQNIYNSPLNALSTPPGKTSARKLKMKARRSPAKRKRKLSNKKKAGQAEFEENSEHVVQKAFTTELPWSPVVKNVSPYKPSRPKAFPRGIKQRKNQQAARARMIEDFKKVDEKLQNIVRSQVVSLEAVKEQPAVDNVESDAFGALTPATIIFAASDQFKVFDENTLQPSDFVNSDSSMWSLSSSEAIRYLKTSSIFSLSVKECRFCCYLFCVTSDRSVVDIISPIILRKISENCFYLGWSDLKQLLINFGLGSEYKMPNSSTRSTEISSVKAWNFEFFFAVLKCSLGHYKTSCVEKVLFFLIDCLFEPLLFDLHARLILFINETTRSLVHKGVPISSLLPLIDRHYLPSTHNRYIFQCLSFDPALTQLAEALGAKSIYDILQIEYTGEAQSLQSIVDKVDDNTFKFETVDVKSVYQAFLIFEKLVLISSSPFKKIQVEKLIRLAEKVSFNTSSHNCVCFSDIIGRLKELAMFCRV